MKRARASWQAPGGVLAAVVLALGVHAGSVVAEEKPKAPVVAEEKTKVPVDEEVVRALESARAQALLKADTAALARMTADEFVEISRMAQLRTKADNLREIATGALKLTSVKYDSLTVQIYGDVAILRGLADNTGTFRGFPFGGKLRYTRVFVRRDGRWQAVAMQHTMMQ